MSVLPCDMGCSSYVSVSGSVIPSNRYVSDDVHCAGAVVRAVTECDIRYDTHPTLNQRPRSLSSTSLTHTTAYHHLPPPTIILLRCRCAGAGLVARHTCHTCHVSGVLGPDLSLERLASANTTQHESAYEERRGVSRRRRAEQRRAEQSRAE